MIYLGEREIGFDGVEIGFPSVLGCRAIVVVTSSGLFGYHLNGSLNPTKRDAFVNFITGHTPGAFKTLYAASAGPGLPADYAELRDIASRLSYTGTIYWAALSVGGSVYVHFQDVGHNTCAITSRPWVDGVDGAAGNKGPYVASADRAIANGAATANMFTNVSPAGLIAVYPTAI